MISGRLSCDRAILATLAAAGYALAGAAGAGAQELAPASLPGALLPPTATDVRVGDLRSQVEQALGEAPERVPGWTVTPSIGISELATDNVRETANGRHADLITAISPTIAVHGDTPRVQLDLVYAPSILLDAFTAHQNTINHNGNAEARVTLVPNALFLDLRGFATLQSATGGFSPSGPTPLNQANQIEVLTGSVAPYYLHRFDDTGDLRLGYVFNKTVTSSGAPGFASTTTTLPAFANLNMTSNEEYGTFRTGPDFGRINNQVWVDATQTSGFGAVDGAHRNVLLDQPAYAIDPRLTIYAQIGYEDIAYPTAVPAVRINDAIWAVGFRITPKPDSVIDVRYGHRDGFNSATVDASYALTARTKIFGRYSEALGSQGEMIASALNGSGVGFGNNSIDAVTGAPVLLTNQLVALQSNLFRTKLLSLSTVTAWSRDTLSLSVLHQEDDLVAISQGVPGFSDRGTSASVTFGHQLSERLGATGTLSYNIYDVTGANAGSERFFTVTLTASYSFSETLSGTVQYSFLGRSSVSPGLLGPTAVAGQSFIENQALIGLRKSF